MSSEIVSPALRPFDPDQFSSSDLLPGWTAWATEQIAALTAVDVRRIVREEIAAAHGHRDSIRSVGINLSNKAGVRIGTAIGEVVDADLVHTLDVRLDGDRHAGTDEELNPAERVPDGARCVANGFTEVVCRVLADDYTGASIRDDSVRADGIAVHVSPSVVAQVLDTPDAVTTTVGDATGSTGSPSGESVAPHLNGGTR